MNHNLMWNLFKDQGYSVTKLKLVDYDEEMLLLQTSTECEKAHVNCPFAVQILERLIFRRSEVIVEDLSGDVFFLWK